MKVAKKQQEAKIKEQEMEVVGLVQVEESKKLQETGEISAKEEDLGAEVAAREDGEVKKGENAMEKQETEQMEEEKKVEEVVEGKTVVVGVQRDAQSRALLTWALVNVAAAGDRVVAVHVVLASAAEAAAAVDFDTMLAVYEGFCNLKQINLKVKICKDSSVRKALVREARLFGASKVVVGVAKKKRAIASSLYIAKYCAKKLPTMCSVVAVSNGKIVFLRDANDGNKSGGRGHSGKVSAELPGCGDNEMYCVVPFQACQGKKDSVPSDEPKDGEESHDGSTKGSRYEDIISEAQQMSSKDPPEMSSDQVPSDAHCSNECNSVKEPIATPKDDISELPAEGASVLYCLLPPRNDHSGRSCGDSKHSTASQKDNDSIELPAEGAGDLYCLLPLRNGHLGRSCGDSKRSIASQKDNDISELPAEGDGELYCLLPRNSHSGRSSGDSKRSLDSKSGLSRSSSFSSDIPLVTEGSPKKDCSVCTLASEAPSSNISTEVEPSSKDAARNSESLSSSPMSLRKMLEGRSDRCRLRRRVLNHKRSSSFEWAKISMVQWAMRLPSRYTSVHPDSKSLKSDASPRLNCDSECESISVVETESLSSFSFYEEAWPPKELESLQEKYSSVCRLFSYEELRLATSNFSPDMLTAKGGTSQVFKAQLFDGKVSAVKILKPSDDALNEFITEIEIVTSLQHDNIISLRGFSFENYSLVLVYDYLPRGSLEKTLHEEQDDKHVLSWGERNRIAIGIAQALDYLHHAGVTQSVIHGDVKSSNVLLSEDSEPQLCDFGLAKQVSASAPHLTCTDITGTFGYLAPEYFLYGKVNEKIDVYAYGVVLLEIISGRRPIRTGCPKGQESLVVWAKPLLSSGEIKQLVDPCLGNDYDCDEMERMTLAAALCTRTSSQSRPKMSLVLKLLQGDDETVDWARAQVSAANGYEGSDDEVMTPDSNIQSHLNLALLGVDDDMLSVCSTDQTIDSMNTSVDDYWSRSSSFD